jgi:hypothetical protein
LPHGRTGALDADAADADPPGPCAVTTTSTVAPTSAFVSEYVGPETPVD